MRGTLPCWHTVAACAAFASLPVCVCTHVQAYEDKSDVCLAMELCSGERCMRPHTHTQAHTHTHIYTYIHTQVKPRMVASQHNMTRTHAYVHARICRGISSLNCACMHIHIHTRTHRPTNRHLGLRNMTHTRRHTNTNTQRDAHRRTAGKLIDKTCTLCDTHTHTHAGGQLLDYIVSKQRFTERDAAGIIRAVVSVIAHCHHFGVVHRYESACTPCL